MGRKFITAGDHPSQMEDIGVELDQTETMASSSLLTTLTDINQAVSKVFFQPQELPRSHWSWRWGARTGQQRTYTPEL